MKDLQDLWSKIPQTSLEEEDIRSIPGRKSITEVDRIKKLLQIELFISWGIVIVTVLFLDNIQTELILLIYTTVFLGTLLNIFTLRSLKKLQVLDDVKSFLKNAVKVLKAFVTGYILTIQIIGAFFIAAFKYLNQDSTPWGEWLLSEQGISILVLYVIVEVILISYAWVFYISRIHSLKDILKEMEN